MVFYGAAVHGGIIEISGCNFSANILYTLSPYFLRNGTLRLSAVGVCDAMRALCVEDLCCAGFAGPAVSWLGEWTASSVTITDTSFTDNLVDPTFVNMGVVSMAALSGVNATLRRCTFAGNNGAAGEAFHFLVASYMLSQLPAGFLVSCPRVSHVFCRSAIEVRGSAPLHVWQLLACRGSLRYGRILRVCEHCRCDHGHIGWRQRRRRAAVANWLVPGSSKHH